MRIRLFVLALSLWSLTDALGAGFESIKVVKASEHGHIIAVGYSANIGVIDLEDGVLLIDAAINESKLEELVAWVSSQYRKPIKYIMNTHEHADHNKNNGYFIERGAAILQQPNKSLGLEVQALTSHTQNDKVIFHQPTGWVFAGDLYSSNWHPVFYAGGTAGVKLSADIIKGFGDSHTLVVPGHGIPQSKAIYLTYVENTLLWINAVKERYAADMTIEQSMQDKELRKIAMEFIDIEGNPNCYSSNQFRRFIERTYSVIEQELKD